jgi:glycosyltransferase involved in cell wall biosynthesis
MDVARQQRVRIALLSTCALATPPKRYGGTELVVAELARGLVELGHQVTVYATGDSLPAGRLRHCFATPIWPPDEMAELRHARFAWQDMADDPERYDVVHMHQAQALAGSAAARCPLALTIHHARVDDLVRQYCSHPNVAYVAISRRQSELSPELGCARVIHHGLDPSQYAAGTGDGDYLAFLGRFAPEKAPHLAIDAAREAGVRVVLGGAAHDVPGAIDYFAREMKPRLADGRLLEWLGELSHGPKVRLLRGARALLFPLEWEEPFGLVMIESMLVGTPVIAFRRGSAPEVVEDGVTGYLVDDVREMTERIRQLDRIDRDRCRARAQERWSTTRMAREYAELYEALVQEYRAAERRARVRRLAPARRTASGPEPLLLPAAATDGGITSG